MPDTILNEQDNYRYYAFISYKREDEEWAKWLQHKLEHYKLPSNLNGRTDLPKEIRPIFKDTSELNPGNLPQQIHDALEQSHYLIVICSPRSANSEWVNREVDTFIGMGRTDKIIPFIIEGSAFSKNPDTECFPQALRNLPAEQEILGANINEMGRDAAAVKVVAQMFGLRFDELWQRYEREKKKKRNRIIVEGVTVLMAIVGVILWMQWQKQQTAKENWEKMENNARFVAKKALELVDQGDSFLAQRLLLDVLPNDLGKPDKPYTQEAEGALRYAATKKSTIFKNHGHAFISASFSPDGRRILSASKDGSIFVWNSDNGKLMLKPDDQSGEPLSSCFSQDGRYFMCQTFFMGEITFWIWESDSGKLIRKIEGYEEGCFTPDGKQFSVVGDDTIVVLDIESGSELKTFERKGLSISYSPDGGQIASISNYSSIVLWDCETGEELRTIDGKSDEFAFALFNPNGKSIVTTSLNGAAIEVWDVATGKKFQTFEGHTDRISSLTFSSDGRQIVSASDDKTIKIWDAASGKLLQTIEGHTDGVVYAELSPDGEQIVSASWDGSVRLWDCQSATDPLTLDCCNLNVNYASFSPDGNHVVVATDSLMMVWNLVADNSKSIFGSPLEKYSFASYSPDGNRIVSSTYDPQSATSLIKEWDANSLELIRTIDEYDKGGFNCVNYSPNGNYIVTAACPELHVLDTKTGELVLDLEGHSDKVYSAMYSSDGSLIVSTSAYWDGTTRVWDAYSGEQLLVIGYETNEDLVASGETGICFDYASFGPDNKHIVTAANNKTVMIWDTHSGKLLHSMNRHNDAVCTASYSPDGRNIVSASCDGTVMVWDAVTGGWVQTMVGHTAPVQCAFYSPNGRRILSASCDGTIKIWDFPLLQELIDQTRERFKDCPLTQEERRLYYLE